MAPSDPQRPDVEDARDLAHDCVTMTLHGPLPLPTSMQLAEHILALHTWVAHLERRSPGETRDLRAMVLLREYEHKDELRLYFDGHGFCCAHRNGISFQDDPADAIIDGLGKGDDADT